MKKYFILKAICILFVWGNVFAQNIGIGTTNPYRARLEVHGLVGKTAAIFGADRTGISLQADWPSIGFNQFYGDLSRHLATGYSAVQFLDPNTGYMAFDMLGSGTGYNYAGPPLRALTLLPNGNVGIHSGGYFNASLVVENGNNTEGTAVFAGQNYNSYFNHSIQQNTYIRAGKDNGIVYINDIPGGKISLGGFTGINTSNPPTYPLEIWQPANDKGLNIRNVNTNYHWEFRVTGSQVLWAYTTTPLMLASLTNGECIQMYLTGA